MSTQTLFLAPYQAAVKVAQAAVDAWEIDADSDEVVASFRDMLSDTYGVIDVCGMKMDAVKVLEGCDPIGFREGLLNYVDGMDKSDFDEYRELCDDLEAAESALSEAKDTLDEAEA